MTYDTAGGLGLDLVAKLDVTVGRMADAAERQARELDRLARTMQPVYFRSADNALAPVSGIVALDLGGPVQGFVWHVRTIVVGGLAPATVAAGAADVFVGGGELDSLSAAPSLMDWRDRAAALPRVAFYGMGEMALRAGESLRLRITGATAAQTYVAACTALVVQEGPDRQSWSL